MQDMTNHKLAKRTLQIQTQILFDGLWIVIGGHIVIGLLLYFYLQEKLASEYLQLWMIALLVPNVLRVFLKYFYTKFRYKLEDKSWCRLYALLSFLSGIAWGAIGVLSADLHSFPLVVLVLCGVSTAAMMTSAAYLLPSLLFVPTTNAPFITLLFLNPDVDYQSMEWFSLAYMVFLIYYLIKTHRSLIKSIQLRFENEQLVHELTAEKDIAEKATQKAEMESLSKSKFLAAASHDLRQPLHALHLFFDALKLSTTLEEREKLYPNINYSIKSLGELLNALLDISKLDANAVDYNLQPTALGEVIDNIAREGEVEASNKGLKLRVRHCDCAVETDPVWLDRVLRNLVSNAIRYTRSGSILIGCRKRGDKVMLQVWDTGIGIPDSEQENIFVEFQQLNNPQRDRNKGLGLGLAIVKRLCKLLGHSIEVKSRMAKGSVFSLTMKLSTQQLQSDDSMSLKLSDNLQGKQTLLIDDEEQINQAMSVLLQKWGCEVVTANSQQEALDKIRQKNIQPDVIIADYRLADNRNGVEAIQAITTALGKTIPALLITGETSPDQINTIKATGYKLLHKPVKPAKLRIMLNKLCKASKTKAAKDFADV
ncbi:MAG: hybrid sensor histidine kinase/response regulator [Gammaproteobacteria bacterium]|nr:hybrid sensor histidine kinase/response regulator [Gammaproteobacteria bacterium]